MKQPPVAVLICKAIGIEKGSAVPNRDKVGRLKRSQMRKIVEQKIQDMNATDIDAAMNLVAGTARSMGVDIVED